MTRLVPRVTADVWEQGDASSISRLEEVVTDSDAAKLEACVEAAKEMRESISCHVNYQDNGICPQDAPFGECDCSACDAAKSFDTALNALTEGRG